jgi:hypothetical protein
MPSNEYIKKKIGSSLIGKSKKNEEPSVILSMYTNNECAC